MGLTASLAFCPAGLRLAGRFVQENISGTQARNQSAREVGAVVALEVGASITFKSRTFTLEVGASVTLEGARKVIRTRASAIREVEQGEGCTRSRSCA